MSPSTSPNHEDASSKIELSELAKETDSKRLVGVQVYRAKYSASTGNSSSSNNSTTTKKAKASSARNNPLRLYTLVFLGLYLYQGIRVLSTAGQPYTEFLEKAEREGFSVMEGATKYRAELEHAIHDLDNADRRTTKLGWFDWMDMDIEQLAEEKKRDKQQSVLDSLPVSMRVPGKYQTAFWPTLLLGILATLHALVWLGQQWSVAFNVALNYQEVDVQAVLEQAPDGLFDLDVSGDDDDDDGVTSSSGAAEGAGSGGNGKPAAKDANGQRIVFPNRELHALPNNFPTHARVIPAKGRHVLVGLEYLPVLGLTLEYHRRRYHYDVDRQEWCKIRCRTNVPLRTICTEWTGFATAHQLVAGQIRHGPNLFQVKQPTFGELYKKQLLNPFSVFQIFCVLLWAIDDYIVYSLFSLGMVLMFEGTVVFQRLKSMQALTSMGNPSRTVYVFRSNRWTPVDSAELLPGDILSLTRVQPHRGGPSKTNKDDPSSKTKGKPMGLKIQDEGGDVVPADLLVLRGTTVVNEASLTGESVPQMKEGLAVAVAAELEQSSQLKNDDDDDDDQDLSMKDKHKMNVVYAGTKMLQCKGASEDSIEDGSSVLCASGIPPPPDQGCVTFVLRTGFASAQGKLVRMIEGSQEKVKGHERETGLLLLLLCVFAIISSSYVLYKGMQNEDRSKYELLLHCILIVTNVIRPELPMQMAMAVNNSIMTLMKMHVFCTEPYRVPVAGKLNSCLFDKTGTLTTDELVAVGVCESSKLSVTAAKAQSTATTNGQDSDTNMLTPMTKLLGEAALVLAGCHTLLVHDGETTGDPLESASLRSMRWHISLTTGHAEPAPAVGKKLPGTSITLRDQPQQSINSVQILARHHFSSKLQRMSCVIQAKAKKYAVAKGSPEAIGKLLASKPDGYDERAAFLSKQGYRVIALAYKGISGSSSDVQASMESRASCETSLVFCGFIAFTCMVRKDTASVLQKLKEGGMTVAMVTGDALLTAIHVAKQVHICEPVGGVKTQNEKEEDKLLENEELQALLQSKRNPESRRSRTQQASKTKALVEYRPIAFLDTTEKGSLYWCSYEDGSNISDYIANDLPRLSETYDLATTGKCLAQAYQDDPETGQYLEHIKVFARMTPVAKEEVIECLHSVGLLCMMCGDGANDVGALKQADVGVALLSGFSNLNVERPDDEAEKSKKEPTGVTAIMSQEHLNQVRQLPVSVLKMKIRQLGVDPSKYPDLVEKEDLVKLYQISARQLAVKRHDEKNALVMKKKTKEEMALEKKKEMANMQAKLLERTAELEAQGVSFASFKAMKEIFAEQSKTKKNEAASKRGVEGGAAALAAQLDDLGGDLPMIKLGDASIAAPFTSKMPSIKNCVDIVRQGRCTLVSSMQMYQIMALQCLISSYSLSVLYLDGVKYGDTQMTALGLLGTVSFMSVSRSKPLDKLSKVQPLSSIFHLASFTSLLGQFAIHLVTMVVAVQSAKSHLAPDYKPELDGQFSPGILNTVVFLVSSVQQVTVFFVNLQGRPFMTGITENRPLLWSLAGTFILTFMFASESVPEMNRYFQLVPFPDDEFRDYILKILVLDLAGTFIFDRVMKFLFARDIFMASLAGIRRTDIFILLRTFIGIGFLMKVFLGNSEQWEELIAMEEAMYNLNETDSMDNATECIEGVCAAVNETVSAMTNSLEDEF